MTGSDSPLYRAAREYIERGWAIIPLRPRGKEPAVKRGLNDWTDNPEQADVWWGAGKYEGRGNPSYNVGMTCGQVSGGVVVIDIDEGGMDELRDWQTAHGELPETVTSITGSGGRHLFYRVGREVRPSVNEEMHIDIRGDGSYVVLPPSIHPNGDPYEWGISPDDMEMADADDLVYSFIDHVRPTRTDHETGEKERFELPDEIVKGRNDTLFHYACSLRSKGLDAASIKVLVINANETRCKPPLSMRELERTVLKAPERYKPGNELKRTEGDGGEPAGLASIFDRPDEPAKKMADETVEKVQNVLLSLREVRDGLKLNVFDGRLHVLAGCIPDVPFRGPHVLEAGESTKLRTVLERDYGIRKKANFEDALLAYGATVGNQYDPMAEVMRTLPLARYPEVGEDGIPANRVELSDDGGLTWYEAAPVLGTILAKYMGCEYDEYNFEAEKLIFRQLVARAKRPGCKADIMTVFVGKQGTGKSTFVSLLAIDRSLFLEGFSDFNVEDLKRISGKLVVEIPELDGFTGKDKNRIKSIITQTTDNYRESYARNPVEHPRTALFFGTTNDGTFLNDNTGGRRYLPIECKAEMLNAHPGLFDGSAEADIRQAWAETAALYDLWGEERFLKTLALPRRVAEESARIQEKYTEEDTIREAVSSFISDCEKTGVTRVNVKMALTKGMGYSEFQWSNAPKWITRTVTAALDDRTGWHRMEGRQLVQGYGTARAWEMDSLLNS